MLLVGARSSASCSHEALRISPPPAARIHRLKQTGLRMRRSIAHEKVLLHPVAEQVRVAHVKPRHETTQVTWNITRTGAHARGPGLVNQRFRILDLEVRWGRGNFLERRTDGKEKAPGTAKTANVSDQRRKLIRPEVINQIPTQDYVEAGLARDRDEPLESRFLDRFFPVIEKPRGVQRPIQVLYSDCACKLGQKRDIGADRRAQVQNAISPVPQELLQKGLKRQGLVRLRRVLRRRCRRFLSLLTSCQPAHLLRPRSITPSYGVVLADRNVILLQVYLTLNASLDHEVFVAAEISLDGNRRTDGCPFLAKLGWVASRLRGCGRLWLGVICI